MEKSIYQLAEELHELIINDERVISLSLKEKEMNESDEVMALSYKKDVAADNYSFAVNHFSNTAKEVSEAQLKLYEAKKDLESHPLVRDYLKSFSEVRKMYDEINKILFSILNVSACQKEND